MKRFIFLLTTIFICTIARADNVSINWIVGDNTYATTQCEMGDDLILPTTPTKTGYTFRGWRIAKYIPIEYLESTGTQYIDTGYKFSQGFKAMLFFELTNTKAGCLFGAWDGNSRNFLWFFGDVMNNYIQVAAGEGGLSYSIQNLTYKNKYEISNKRYAYLKLNTLEQTELINDISYNYNNLSFYIFARNDSDNANFFISIKLYSLQLYDNDVLVRDFIPVLDGDGVPCMYDRVEGKFYYNAGTGQFIAGPVIGE